MSECCCQARRCQPALPTFVLQGRRRSSKNRRPRRREARGLAGRRARVCPRLHCREARGLVCEHRATAFKPSGTGFHKARTGALDICFPALGAGTRRWTESGRRRRSVTPPARLRLAAASGSVPSSTTLSTRASGRPLWWTTPTTRSGRRCAM